MLNFIIDTQKYDKCGVKFRYADFITFLSDYNIPYTIDKNINNEGYNIIDINYLDDNPQFELQDNCYVFCGSSRKIISILYTYYKKHNTLPNYNNYITHNLYYANSLDAIFMPMFLYNNDIKMIKTQKKYKYGIYANFYDVSYLIYKDVLNILSISLDDVLFMDNQNCVSKKCNRTSDKHFFYSHIETFLDFSNDYANRHVMSRTCLELIANNIPIHIISFYNSIPVSFKNFNHIKYYKIKEFNEFNLLGIEYQPKYFLTKTYSDYIKYLANNMDKHIKYESVEEYANENFYTK